MVSSSMRNILSVYYDQQRQYTYAQAAACTWLAYDILLTFADEWAIVWKRKWTLPKLLYIIARYYALVNLILYLTVSTNTARQSDKYCKIWFGFYASGPIIIPFVVDTLLVIRLYALYQQSKTILSVLLFFWIGQPAIAIVACILMLASLKIVEKPSFYHFPGCLSAGPEKVNFSMSAWLFALVAQMVYFLLILNKYIKSIHELPAFGPNRESFWQTVRQSHNLSPLVSLFLRDGSAYFLCLFAAMFVNLLCTRIPDGPFKQMGIPWIVATNAVMASRLYLNLGGYLYRTATPSLGSYEHHIQLPSGAMKTIIGYDAHDPYASTGREFSALSDGSELACTESISNPFSRRGSNGSSDASSTLNECGGGDEVLHRSIDKVRIPSLKFGSEVFDGFAPEVIELSDLESASDGIRSGPLRSVLDEPMSSRAPLSSSSTKHGVQSASSISSLPGHGTPSDIVQRPPFPSASSSFMISKHALN